MSASFAELNLFKNYVLYITIPAATATYTLSLHDALPILLMNTALESPLGQIAMIPMLAWIANSAPADRKSTRLNSSHLVTSYAVSCSKKKIEQNNNYNKCS